MLQTATAAAPIAPPPPLPALPAIAIPDDFPDWLSPIIVKEVRQGMRGRTFTIAFMLLHTMLFLWAIGMSLSVETSSGGDGFFWFILGMGLVCISIAAQGAIRTERTGNTIELLQLTRQGAGRIVFGKWCAILTQSALLIASMAPYMVLRYFFGTFEIVRDLSIIVILFLWTAAGVAFMLLLSCFPRWFGIGNGILIFILGSSAFSVLSSSFFFGRALGGLSPVTGWGLLGCILFPAAYVLLFLFLAAAQIAPVSENFASRTRLVCWFLLLPAAIAILSDAGKEASLICMIAALPGAVGILDALLRPTSPSLSVFTAFGRRGFAGYAAALLLAPSRATGVFYAVVTLAIFFILPLLSVSNPAYRPVAISYISTLNTLLLPMALACITRRTLPAFSFTMRFWLFFVLEWVLFGASCLIFLGGSKWDAWESLAGITPPGMAIFSQDTNGKMAFCFISVTVVFIAACLGRYLWRDLQATLGMCGGKRVEIPDA